MKTSYQSSVISHRFLKLIICILSLFTFHFSLFTLSFAEEEIKLEEVVVTATRYEEQPSKVPANITVITEKDIKNSSAQNIPELLKTEIGIQVNDITGNRRNYTVDLRGFGETAPLNTLVLVDGRRINQPDLSGVDWTEIPLERVKRIEIIRGGRGSILYGDNATGGVINIITKEGDTFKAGGELSAGSYGTFKSSAYLNGSSNGLSISLTGNYLTSDGYRDNSSTEAKDVGLNASYTPKDFIKLYFSTGYHKDTTGLPGALKESDFAAGASRTDSKHPDDYMDVEDYYFKFVPEVSFLDDNIFKIDTSFRKRAFLSFSSGDFGNFLGDSEIKTVIVSPQILFNNTIGVAKNTLTLGVDYVKADNDIVNRSLFFGVSSIGLFDLQKKNYGYYLHDEINILDRLYLSGGYRYDRVEFTFNPSTPNEETDMHKDLFTAGINYTFYKKSYIYLSFSRSFRYPLLDELYSFFTNTVNTDLVPQSTDDYEVGIRHYFTDDIYAHLNFFRIDTDKEIFFNPITYTNENMDGKTRRDGIEISFFVKPIEWLTLRAGYAYLDAEIKEGTFKGKEVPNVPKHKASLDVVTFLGRGFTFALNGVYVAERPFISDFTNDFGDQESYLVLNSKINYHWKYLNAFLNINNLTNTKYSEFGVIGGFPIEKAFYPSPRINFLAGVTIDF
jgi:iron complex outermembrane receptor protein